MPNPTLVEAIRNRIRATVPTVIRQNREFEAAMDDELTAEIAFLQGVVAMIKPALEYLGGPLDIGPGRGFVLIPGESWIGCDGQFYGREGNRFVPITARDVLDTRGALDEALNAIATALEQCARGKLPKRTEQARSRGERLRALLPLLRGY